jgi:hypothetical protein
MSFKANLRLSEALSEKELLVESIWRMREHAADG